MNFWGLDPSSPRPPRSGVSGPKPQGKTCLQLPGGHISRLGHLLDLDKEGIRRVRDTNHPLRSNLHILARPR